MAKTENGSTMVKRPLPAEALTRPPGHHFFGYYDKPQFDPGSRRALGHRCGFSERLQRPDDEAVIGFVDTADGNRWESLSSTTAWSWQMGSMLQWLPGPGESIIFNDRAGAKFVSVILDISSGRKTLLPVPVYTVHPRGGAALTLDFQKLWRLRPETGYCGGACPGEPVHPGREGVFSVDLGTGETRLLVSFEDIPEYNSRGAGECYFTHLSFNPSGTRFSFWFRCRGEKSTSSLYTADSGGGDLFRVTDNNSHCAWLGDDKIIAWANPGKKLNGSACLLFQDKKPGFEYFGGGRINFNGHFSFSPDRRWLLTDTPTDSDERRHIMLYDFKGDERFIRIGSFFSPLSLSGPCRCDPHPRWDRSGRKICFDSVHEGTRQMYAVDIGSILEGVE